MPFPAATEVTAEAYLSAKREARAVKAYMQSANTTMAAGSVSCNQIVEIYVRLIAAKARFNAVAAVPGIAQYARDQENNQGLDIVAEFTTMTDAVTTVGTWIATNIPKDGSGYLLKDKLDASGVSVRALTPAQTAGLRTKIDSLIATIA